MPLRRRKYHRQTAVAVARMLVEASYYSCQTKDRGSANVGNQTVNETNCKSWVDSRCQLAKSRHKPASKKPGASGTTRLECSGDEVLRKHGGGYLLVATLSALDRALAFECELDVSFVADAHSPNTSKHKQGEQSCSAISFKHIGAEHEVKQLLVLLGSLLRLGSSGPIVGNGTSGDHQGTSPKSNPPLVSEVNSALEAASPSALRRRVSIDLGVGVAHQYPYLRSVSTPKRSGQSSSDYSHGSPIKVTAKRSEVPGPVAVHTPGGYISPLLQQRGTLAASTYPAKKSKKPIPWSEPRRPSIDATSASTYAGGSRRAGHGRGSCAKQVDTSRLQTIDANETELYTADDRMVRRRSLSSSSGLTPGEIASIVDGPPGASVEGFGRASLTHTGVTGTTSQQVPRSEFYKCGGGNFAVLLATRWKRGTNDGEESGFAMLARLALGESLCLPCHSPSKERHWWWKIGSRSSGAQSSSRTADLMDRKWRKGAQGYRWTSSSARGMHEKRWQRRGANVSRADWSEGEGGTSPAETLAILATEMIRDYFLGQVRGVGCGIPA